MSPYNSGLTAGEALVAPFFGAGGPRALSCAAYERRSEPASYAMPQNELLVMMSPTRRPCRAPARASPLPRPHHLLAAAAAARRAGAARAAARVHRRGLPRLAQEAAGAAAGVWVRPRAGQQLRVLRLWRRGVRQQSAAAPPAGAALRVRPAASMAWAGLGPRRIGLCQRR